MDLLAKIEEWYGYVDEYCGVDTDDREAMKQLRKLLSREAQPYPFHCSKCGQALTFDKHECRTNQP